MAIGVTLSAYSVVEGTAADITVYVTEAPAGAVSVVLKAPDGTTSSQSVTANAAGFATGTISPTSLAEGVYSVTARGSGGVTTSTALIIK